MGTMKRNGMHKNVLPYARGYSFSKNLNHSILEQTDHLGLFSVRVKIHVEWVFSQFPLVGFLINNWSIPLQGLTV